MSVPEDLRYNKENSGGTIRGERLTTLKKTLNVRTYAYNTAILAYRVVQQIQKHNLYNGTVYGKVKKARNEEPTILC